VVIEPNIPCFACPPCRSGHTSGCLNRVSLGYNAPGVLAERIAVPSEFGWAVPAGWADEDAVCAEPLTVALAAMRRAGVPGSPAGRCLVIGAGSQGLLLCVALTAAGVVPYVLEPHDGRRALAASVGARPSGPDDDGFGVIFETSGSAAGAAEAIRRAAPEATVVLIGLTAETGPGRRGDRGAAPAAHPGLADLRPPRGLRRHGQVSGAVDAAQPGAARPLPTRGGRARVPRRARRPRQDLDPARPTL
jgi:threonine dehydrogenase-like Zn-dependent dehydrogenase